MYVPIVPSSCKKIYISIFFREKKIQNKTKEFSVKTNFQEKRERELHLLKKWNDDICDIFPYDTFYRLETKVTKNKTKKNIQKKKLVLTTKFTKLLL